MYISVLPCLVPKQHSCLARQPSENLRRHPDKLRLPEDRSRQRCSRPDQSKMDCRSRESKGRTQNPRRLPQLGRILPIFIQCMWLHLGRGGAAGHRIWPQRYKGRSPELSARGRGKSPLPWTTTTVQPSPPASFPAAGCGCGPPGCGHTGHPHYSLLDKPKSNSVFPCLD
jgi:hypothetical protein